MHDILRMTMDFNHGYYEVQGNTNLIKRTHNIIMNNFTHIVAVRTLPAVQHYFSVYQCWALTR